MIYSLITEHTDTLTKCKILKERNSNIISEIHKTNLIQSENIEFIESMKIWKRRVESEFIGNLQNIETLEIDLDMLDEKIRKINQG